VWSAYSTTNLCYYYIGYSYIGKRVCHQQVVSIYASWPLSVSPPGPTGALPLYFAVERSPRTISTHPIHPNSDCTTEQLETKMAGPQGAQSQPHECRTRVTKSVFLSRKMEVSELRNLTSKTCAEPPKLFMGPKH